MKLSEDMSRLEELWADRASGCLDSEGERELRESVRRLGVDDAYTAADFALGALYAGLVAQGPIEELPASVRARILADIPVARRTRIGSGLLPWAAMAAAVFLAVMSWWPRPGASGPLRTAEVDARADRVSVSWGDWDSPEVPGVKGEVVWSESLQTGYMRFRGLPANDPARDRYQLWIIDDRGMQQRISGGIFDSTGGETVVPISPGIKVNNAAAFAVTIEPPTGVWVSDMSRRVSIATVTKK
ncbi:MAG: anti-sigma factor domain-containing protein [Phycisphaerales bacterium]